MYIPSFPFGFSFHPIRYARDFHISSVNVRKRGKYTFRQPFRKQNTKLFPSDSCNTGIDDIV